MKTECDSLAVWAWKDERETFIRERGWQGIAMRLAREFAVHARALDAVGTLEDPEQAHALLSGLAERQQLVVVMMADMFGALDCGCRAYPAPWPPADLAEVRGLCSAFDAARLAHHLRTMSHFFEGATNPDRLGGVAVTCNCLEDSIRRHPIFVVEVLYRLSNAVRNKLKRDPHGKA